MLLFGPMGDDRSSTARRIARLRRVIPSVLATCAFPAFAASDSGCGSMRVRRSGSALLQIGTGPFTGRLSGACLSAPMERLHGEGPISEPATKARSVMLTETGLREAEAAFHRLFDAKDKAAG